MFNNANEQQRRAIFSRKPLVVVNAGAGTGKTWTLASRFVSLLLDAENPCGVNNILTLTFTEKAAQEMRDRIFKVMSDAAKDNTLSDKERSLLSDALSHFDDSVISTIHSFALSAVRQNCLTMDIDPKFVIETSAQIDEFRNSFATALEEHDFSIFSHLLDKEEEQDKDNLLNDALFQQIVDRYRPEKIADAAEKCESLHSAMGRTPDDFLALCGDSDTSDETAEQRILMRICALGWKLAERQRSENGVLSFSDMIRLASNGKELTGSERFRRLMIDEFQDTDPLQGMIVETLRKNNNSDLFVVGDAKQSIYRFRNADLRLFSDYAEEARSPLNEYIALNFSFRMRKSVYEPINKLFKSVWPDKLGEGLNIEYEPIDGIKDELRDSCTVPAITAIIEEKNADGNEKEKIDTIRRRLLRRLGKTLISWKRMGLTVFDKGATRAMRWSDCAVLSAARTSWNIAEDELKKLGIPIVLDGYKGWFSRGEVTDTVNMIQALAFPHDKAARMGWERSIFAPSPDMRDSTFERLRKIAQLYGATGVFSYYREHAEWLFGIREGLRARALANLKRASELAKEYENNVSRSLQGVADWLTSAMRSQREIEEPADNSDTDAVHFLTVFASKGLEFPITVLWGTEVQPKYTSNTSLKPSRFLGLVSKRQKNLCDIHSQKEREAIDEEWKRVFYVAATRAKDALIFCGIKTPPKKTTSNRGKSWLDMSCDWLELNAKAPDISDISDTDAARETNDTKAKESVNGSPQTSKQQTPTRLTRISATSWTMYNWCPFAWRRCYRQGDRATWQNFNGESVGGANVGSLTHWILSKWDFSVETISRYIPLDGDAERLNKVIALLPLYLRETYRNGAVRAEIRKWLSDLALSQIGCEMQRLCYDGKLQREVNFNSRGMAGIIDVFWDDADGVHLRDWKTIADTPLAEKQLRFYAVALRDIFDKTPSDMGIITVRDARYHSFSVNLDIINNTRSQINEDARICVNGPWKPKTEHCAACQWKQCIIRKSDI